MPLPREVLATVQGNIKEAESALKELETEIGNAYRAGLNVDDMKKQSDELKTKIRQLKAVYGGK
jgi:phage shock protein A